MFEVHDILVKDNVAKASFACNLAACRGACCVQGDSGAPLEEHELRWLDEVVPRVRKYLRPEALDVIDRQGAWEKTKDGRFVTSCVGDAECVFVTYDGDVAKCSIQKAFGKGKVDHPKPISCHLFPIRVERRGEHEVLDYEKIKICSPARKCGSRHGVGLAEFLREPLTRKYGPEWYENFINVCEERRNFVTTPISG